ncbi:hypothetical protein SHO565_72410 [Streptomyces sp. HO565]
MSATLSSGTRTLVSGWYAAAEPRAAGYGTTSKSSARRSVRFLDAVHGPPAPDSADPGAEAVFQGPPGTSPGRLSDAREGGRPMRTPARRPRCPCPTAAFVSDRRGPQDCGRFPWLAA